MGLKYMPVNIRLKDRKCLVVGGGAVALRKIETLMEYDTDITVIAPEVDKKIEYYAGRGNISIKHREYQSPEALDYGLVISATDDNAINEKVCEDCRKVGVPVNVVDNPPLCDFIFPATLHRDCLSVSVSSDGQAPFLSGHIKTILEEMFEKKRWTTIAQLASVFRNRVQKKFEGDTKMKLASFANFLNTDWKQTLEEVPDEALSDYIDDLLEKEKTEEDEQTDN